MPTGAYVGLIFIGIGIVMVWLAARDLRLADASRSWSVTDGTIIRTRVRANDRGEQSESYAPELAYSYTVMGTSYEGSRVGIGASAGYSQRSQAEAYLERYPVGHPVTVFYDPNRPAQSALEVGTRRGAYRSFFMAGVFTLIGMLVLVSALQGN